MLEMLPYFAAAAIGSAVTACLVVMTQKTKGEKHDDALIEQLTAQISELETKPKLPDDEGGVTRTEFQELQRSVEKIHADVLGWLKAISAKEQRVFKARERDEQEDPGLTHEAALELLRGDGNGTPAAPNSELTIDQIEAMG